MNKVELTHQVVDMSLKADPPFAVTVLSVWGVALPDVVAILTILYLVIHIGYIVTKWVKGR